MSEQRLMGVDPVVPVTAGRRQNVPPRPALGGCAPLIAARLPEGCQRGWQRLSRKQDSRLPRALHAGARWPASFQGGAPPRPSPLVLHSQIFVWPRACARGVGLHPTKGRDQGQVVKSQIPGRLQADSAICRTGDSSGPVLGGPTKCHRPETLGPSPPGPASRDT